MRVVAFLTACGISAASTAVAMAAGPPVVSAGPVVGPSGTATASGTVASGGQTDACVNDQHSGANPSGSDTSGAAQVNDRGCAAGGQPGGGSPGGGQAAGSRSGASASGAQAGGGRAQTASVGGARARTSVVMAGQAVGLRIASIRFSTAGINSTRRLGVQVTVRDRRGLLVRDAIVSIAGLRGGSSTIACTMAAYSDRLGRASFRLPVDAKLGGKRVLVAVSARTPQARVRRVAAVRLPRLAAA